MKKTWIVPCCALGMLLYAGRAQAAFWQVLRDTPVRADAAAGAKVLGTAQKGWIVSDMTGDGSSPQWIRMVEFQTKAGEGMAYAHFVYKVPDAYISAADVVQVADENGTPLQKSGTAAAATAQGVRVERMVAPQVTDLACNGAVDGAVLKAALEAWVQACNAVLGRLEGMEPDEAATTMLAWADEDPFASADVEAMDKHMAALLDRWLSARYGHPQTPLGADDQKVLALLAAYGLIPQMAEGTTFFTADVNVLRKRVSFEPPVAAYSDYMSLRDSQPSVLFTDGGCRYPVKEMGTWAVQWERYLNTVPADSVYFKEGKKRYLEFMTHILFSDLPNTPAFPHYNKGRMEKAWMTALRSVALENSGTQTAALITEFLDKIKVNDNRLSAAYAEALWNKMRSPSFPRTN
ncbi:MAG: hypothetical protein SPI23_04465 [Desulfovibrio sp.]|uniref:hypothetical protein n=1 Tax=Desulfovibrio sp. TaxID=885 RepID=UPI002A9202DC|nr:hypothetical protein [Desulfovibrio sp.]MDY6233912.1 hypothetical protein [Desulfovibrio sp.]